MRRTTINPKPLPLVLDCTKSLLDDILADCPAQYAVDDGSGNEKPESGWLNVGTVLRDLDTTKTHYVQTQKFDKHFIVMDFDIRNSKGEKDQYLNLEAASKWPATYAEFSKGGSGVHLHYIYDGDVDKLQTVYADGIEIKVFRGRAALRRRVSKCNDIPIAHLAEGTLPLKEEKMIDTSVLKDEMHLRNLIKKCLRKGNHGATRPEIDLIAKALDDAYKSGMVYDVGDMEHDILVFAMNSTHQSDYCVKKVNEMRFESEDKKIEEESLKKEEAGKKDEAPIVFFDVEVFPNLFVLNWKFAGPENKVVRMINPKPRDVEKLFAFRLVGFNNRKYDNHIIYGRYLGLNNEQLFDLSQRIIVESAKEAFYPEAYNLSYTDIYDYSAKKQSLKKWEIELGIHHQELGLPWDQPVPEELWEKVAEYCDNDVIATEAVFNYTKGDFEARLILTKLANAFAPNIKSVPNDTTNTLTGRIVFMGDKHPQREFVYTDFSTGKQYKGGEQFVYE